MNHVQFFKCLSDETRLSIVILIAENKEQCVCDLTDKLQVSQSKISRHLALLRSCGLLNDRRQSQWVYYSINPQLPAWCFEILSALKHSPSLISLPTSALPIQSHCE
ncbi:metalloregulator ArsR/SmtB family transcription factor [Acinetobacter sp. ANC 4635]|uniref:metalloregulator ArsR/SmtB family transcription factor n=1 Tax=Acinetobacter sp. ANC 4635 TaxID=2529846 RepID=UPI00103D0ED5|nr:metalloregulator ArsR/SmtB family transcription factor [Acinetobacter sp. ANC 4635]TCB24437.1 metalloregulator ArsR/SmtB family transcription factor [Acinetobacter sp. ANC 4635]